MSHITYTDVNAWLEPSKLALTSQSDLNAELLNQIEQQVFGRLETVFDTSLWINEDSTPTLIKSTIAMYYTAWTYDKAYSDDAESNFYADKLRALADLQLSAIMSGNVSLLDDTTGQANVAIDTAGLSFYPNDLSSSNVPSLDDPSAGGPSFTMGTVF